MKDVRYKNSHENMTPVLKTGFVIIGSFEVKVQGFFSSVSGAEIRPHYQCNLGDFFPNLKEKIPNHS